MPEAPYRWDFPGPESWPARKIARNKDSCACPGGQRAGSAVPSGHVILLTPPDPLVTSASSQHDLSTSQRHVCGRVPRRSSRASSGRTPDHCATHGRSARECDALVPAVAGRGRLLRRSNEARSDGPHKAPLGSFLARNPFDSPWTLGFFYREKMRAIHYVAPDEPQLDVLDVGGGQGGLAALLYPQARITNIDLDARYAAAPCNRQPRVRFLCGDATALPLPDASVDVVAMFDLLEHVEDDRAAVGEAFRVLRQGGILLVSTPHRRWRFPYYAPMRPISPTEQSLFAEWGHVRRGYTVDELRELIGLEPERVATFINPVTVVSHDFAFSRLPRLVRKGICTGLLPITWLGYVLHRPGTKGTETATAWRKPVS